MAEPVHVEKPCCSLDILPTLSNLFGVPYDSRLLMGRDIFSDAEPLIVFSNHSFITDRGRFIAASDLFVLPSYREGFGMSVVEAEAMGLPVVVTDIPGPTDAVKPDETGLVVPVKDPGALARAIEALLTDGEKRAAMGSAGRTFAEKSFDSRIFAQKLMENRKKLTNF